MVYFVNTLLPIVALGFTYIFILLVILFPVYIFLIMPRIFRKPDRNPLYGVYYAHRGLFDNNTDAPENSLAAFRKAVEAGYGIEFDVQLSKDKIPVVFHDATLNRMCGIDGNVWDYTYEELHAMKLKDSEETIPSFAEVLEVIGGKVPLIIEYKLDVPSDNVCKLANEILCDYSGVYCIESFHPLALMWYKKNRPDIIRGQLSCDYSKGENLHGIKYWIMTNLLSNALTRPDFISYKHSDYNVFSRKMCSHLGALPVAWTVKSQKDLDLVKDEFKLFIFDSFEPRE